MDIVYLGSIILLLIVTVAFVAGCAKLGGSK